MNLCSYPHMIDCTENSGGLLANKLHSIGEILLSESEVKNYSKSLVLS